MSCVRAPSAFNSLIWIRESFTQHPPTRQPPLWCIDIALKLGAQLSISNTIFQVFGMTRLWLVLTTFSYQVELLSMRVLRRRSYSFLKHGSQVNNTRPLDNHLCGLLITLSGLRLSWIYWLPFFKSLVRLGCGSNSKPPVLVASALPLHCQTQIFVWSLEGLSYKVFCNHSHNFLFHEQILTLMDE